MGEVKKFWADLCVHHIEAVRYSDYAALEAELATVKKVAYGNMELLEENAKLRAELAAFKSAVDHVTADGKTTRSFSASEGWAMVHMDRLTDLHVVEERLSELERRAVPDGFVLAPVKPTEEMLKAGDGYMGTPATYKAMLSAIPNTITTEFSQFLSAVMDAAGLVRHGRQSKGLSEYLGSQCMKYRLAAAPSAPKADDSDADNYRWLREQHNNVNSDIGVYNGVNILATQEGELDLDAAIAAARKGEWE